MYRCFLCKDPVTEKEHRRVQKITDPVSLDELSPGQQALPEEDDCFDDNGYVVLCENCMKDAEIEAVDWDHEYERDAFYSNSQYVETGICLNCGRPYQKTISESNVSRTGYCYRCGFNP